MDAYRYQTFLEIFKEIYQGYEEELGEEERRR
jgi:hypothetical protein